MMLSSSVELNLKHTELCLGMPGAGAGDTTASGSGNKRGFSETIVDLNLDFQLQQPNKQSATDDLDAVDVSQKDPTKPPAKAQVVGWPPVRSYRKNTMTCRKSNGEDAAVLVKVSMDGAPYLRKVDLKTYKSYQDLSAALSKMFSSFTIGNYGDQGMIDFMNESKLMDLLNSSDYVPTYEDKDGDWMLVGDVPWEMFVETCKRLRIMNGSEAIGLAPRAMEKCKRRT